jgi:hypothetical protein
LELEKYAALEALNLTLPRSKRRLTRHGQSARRVGNAPLDV